MRKFFGEFKKFITRGNVMDLAVGVIIGGAFTAIVNAVTKNILQPLINAVIAIIFGNGGDQVVYTFLVGSAESLETAIYIDWGAVISAIIDFILIALVLFIIVRTFNKVKDRKEKALSEYKKMKPTKEDKKAMKAKGIKIHDRDAVKAFMIEKNEKIAEAAKLEEEKKKAEEEEAKKHSTEGLLESIKALLEGQIKKEEEKKEDAEEVKEESKAEEVKE